MTLLKMISAIIAALLLAGCASDPKADESDWDETYYASQEEIDEFTRGEGVGIWTSALFYAQERVGFEEIDSQPQPEILIDDLRQTISEEYLCADGDTEALYCYQPTEGSTDTYRMNWDPDDTGMYQTTITLGETWVEVDTTGPMTSQYCLRKEAGANYEDPDTRTVIEDLTLTATLCQESSQ